jgi:hypothetical protein
MKTKLVAGAAVCSALVVLMALPNNSSATTAKRPTPTPTPTPAPTPAPVVDDDQELLQTPGTEENHSKVEWACKIHLSFCRSSRECCPAYICRYDRYRGGQRCVY